MIDLKVSRYVLYRYTCIMIFMYCIIIPVSWYVSWHERIASAVNTGLPRNYFIAWKATRKYTNPENLFHWLKKRQENIVISGPDKFKPIVLQTRHKELDPILQLIFQRSIDQGKLPYIWKEAMYPPSVKRETDQIWQTINPFPFLCPM